MLKLKKIASKRATGSSELLKWNSVHIYLMAYFATFQPILEAFSSYIRIYDAFKEVLTPQTAFSAIFCYSSKIYKKVQQKKLAFQTSFFIGALGRLIPLKLHSLRSSAFADRDTPVSLSLAVKPAPCRFASTPILPTKKLAFQTSFFIGALGRNRTGTGLLPTDFKSAASTCSATSAYLLHPEVIHIKIFICNIKLEFFIKICNMEMCF